MAQDDDSDVKMQYLLVQMFVGALFAHWQDFWIYMMQPI
jgi:hypothetical protein